MIGITVNVNDGASDAIAEFAAGLQPEALNGVVGETGVRVYQDHLRTLERDRPNALGGSRTHFYANAARATNWRPVEGGVMISINHLGMAQRYYGGVIKPVRKKYLTEPAIAEAHGKTAAEFPDLVLVFGRGGEPYALARRDNRALDRGAASGNGGAIGQRKPEIVFWLKKSVSQKPDPSVLPAEETVQDEIGRRVLSYATRLWQRSLGGPRGRTMDGGNN